MMKEGHRFDRERFLPVERQQVFPEIREFLLAQKDTLSYHASGKTNCLSSPHIGFPSVNSEIGLISCSHIFVAVSPAFFGVSGIGDTLLRSCRRSSAGAIAKALEK